MDYKLKEDGGYTYIEEGQGETLLLLHGLFGALSNWKDVLETFSKNYRVVIPLMPVYQLPILNTSVKGLADFVHSFIEYKGYKRVTLLGNSLGGHVALVYAVNFPEKVYAMMLTGSSGLYENSFGGTYPKKGDYEFIKKKVEFTFYDPATATKELVDEVYSTVIDRNRVIRIIAMAKSAIRHNMKNDLSKIKVPVCLIWGMQDQITPPEVAEEFHRLMPNSELHWLDKCGHAAMMERAAEFNVILEGFLTKIFKNETHQSA